MPDIIPFRRPVRTGFVGPHEYREYEGFRPPGHLYSPPEYLPSPEYETVNLPAESRLFDPEISPFMDPELIATIERKRRQIGILQGLRAQTEERLEALPEEQKPAARKWLAESRAITAPTAIPTTREEASQLAIRKIGFDPDLIDPNKIIQKQFQLGLPKVIQSVFKKGPGQLTPQENEYLQTTIIPIFQKQVTNSVVTKVRAGQGYYKRAMAEYDKGQQAKSEAIKKAEEARRYKIAQDRLDRKEKLEREEAQEEEEKLEWVVNRKAGLKRQVTPEKADALVKTGDWKRGRPIGEEKIDKLTKSQMLDDWRADYKTRLSQLEKRYGQFNVMTGMWMPNPDTIEEYKREAAKLEKEYEEGTRSILQGKVPKRMTGALAIESKKKDYVSDLIKNLTRGY